MNGGFGKRSTLVLLALSAMTISQLGVGSIEESSAPGPNVAITAGAIAIALVKVRIILREFMDVRHAPILLRRLTDAWVVATGLVLLVAYFAGTAFARG